MLFSISEKNLLSYSPYSFQMENNRFGVSLFRTEQMLNVVAF